MHEQNHRHELHKCMISNYVIISSQITAKRLLLVVFMKVHTWRVCDQLSSWRSHIYKNCINTTKTWRRRRKRVRAVCCCVVSGLAWKSEKWEERDTEVFTGVYVLMHSVSQVSLFSLPAYITCNWQAQEPQPCVSCHKHNMQSRSQALQIDNYNI